MRAIAIKKRPRAAILAAMLAALLAGGVLAERAWAPRDCGKCGPAVAEFGLVGIIDSQTLRLSAVNIAPEPRFGQSRCRVSLGFADITGGAVGNPDERNLAPGEGTFVDLPAVQVDDPNLRAGGRAQLRPMARITQDGLGCGVMFAAEVFGPVGATEVYIQDREP